MDLSTDTPPGKGCNHKCMHSNPILSGTAKYSTEFTFNGFKECVFKKNGTIMACITNPHYA